MKKYPKAWISAARGMNVHGKDFDEHAALLLDALDAVGALKEVPQPREWWGCDACGLVFNMMAGITPSHICRGMGEHYIRLQGPEVEDSDDR